MGKRDWDLPRTLGPYTLVQEIGRGGMGVVYRAHEDNLDRDVALKVIRESWIADDEDVARFKNEARLAASLSHRGIVDVYASHDSDGETFFTMQLVDGPNLKQWSNLQPRSISDMSRMIQQVARAVGYAHQQDVLHRDIKPANILVNANGEPLLTDFGLARSVDPGSDELKTKVMGTYHYLAPERLRRESSRQSDVYSIGAVLYELLAGRPTHHGIEETADLNQARSDSIVPLRRLNPRVPKDLETICMKCLQHEPKLRYTTAIELADDLQRFLCGEPIQARPPSLAYRAQRFITRYPVATVLGLAASLGLVCAIGGIGFAIASVGREREAKVQRFEALARSARETGAIGQRTESLRFIAEAASIPVERDPHQTLQRRNAIIDSLRRPDLNYVQLMADADVFAVDNNFQNYARVLDDGSVEVRTIASNEVMSSLPVDGQVIELEFSPNAKFLAVVSANFGANGGHRLHVWSVGDDTTKIFDDSISGSSWQFTRGGERLVVGLSDGRIERYRLTSSGSKFDRLIREETWTNGFAVDPDSNEIVFSISEPPYVTVHDLESGDFQYSLLHQSQVRDLAWSPDGSRLASTSGRTVHLWDIGDRKIEDTFDDHVGNIGAATFNPLGTHLAVHAWNGRIHLWDLRNRSKVMVMPGTSSFGFAPDDNRVSGVTRGGRPAIAELLIDDFFISTKLRRPRNQSSPLGSADAGSWCVDACGDFPIAAATHLSGVNILSQQDAVHLAEMPIGHCTACRFLPNGVGFITSGRSGVLFWPMQRSPDQSSVLQVGWPGRLMSHPEIQGHELAVAKRGDCFAFVSQNRRLACFRSSEASPLATPESFSVSMKESEGESHRIESVSMDGKGKLVAVGTWNQQPAGIRLFGISSPKSVRSVSSHHEWPAIRPDGLQVAWASNDMLRLRNLQDETTREITLTRTPMGDRIVVAYSSDGQWIAVNDSDRSVSLIDSARGLVITKLRMDQPVTITSLAFGRSNQRLYAAGQQNRICVWNLEKIQQVLRDFDVDWSSPTRTSLDAEASRVNLDRDESWEPIDRINFLGHQASKSLVYPAAFSMASPDDSVAAKVFRDEGSSKQ